MSSKSFDKIKPFIQDFSAISSRIGKVSGIDPGINSHLARVLGGVTPTAIGTFKKKGRFPTDRIVNFCFNFNVSLDWLLTGEGNISQKRTDEKYSPPENKDFKKLEEEIEMWKDKYISLMEEHSALKDEVRGLEKKITQLEKSNSGAGFDVSAPAKNSSRK